MKISNWHDRMIPSWWSALGVLVLAATAGLFLVFYPVYQGVSVKGSSSGVVTSSSESGTLIPKNGLWALVSSCIPIVLAALGLIAVARKVSSLLGFLAVHCSASSCSPVPYWPVLLPAAIALLLSAGLTYERRKRADAPGVANDFMAGTAGT